MKFESGTLEETLFADLDKGWGRPMPVKLFTYEDGSHDLHRQTGTDFDQAVDKAKELLRARGYTVGEVEFIGPTGAYMPVTRAIDTSKTA